MVLIITLANCLLNTEALDGEESFSLVLFPAVQVIRAYGCVIFL